MKGAIERGVWGYTCFIQEVGGGCAANEDSQKFENTTQVPACLHNDKTNKPELYILRGGSRILRRKGGANPPRRGRQPMILPNFPKNYMKLRKFWTVGGTPGDPPLILML